jgi:hypothetical protein
MYLYPFIQCGTGYKFGIPGLLIATFLCIGAIIFQAWRRSGGIESKEDSYGPA